jgi:hypothetical protein
VLVIVGRKPTVAVVRALFRDCPRFAAAIAEVGKPAPWLRRRWRTLAASGLD